MPHEPHTEIMTPGGMISLTREEMKLLVDCIRSITDCLLIQKRPCALECVDLHNKINTIDKRLNYEPVVFPLNVKVRRVKKRKAIKYASKTKRHRGHA
jgi:hypothetical protein